MRATDVLVVGGFVLLLLVLVAAGTWWQLWVARKVSGRFLNRARLDKLDPASRKRLEERIRRIPGGKQLLAKAGRSVDGQASDESK